MNNLNIHYIVYKKNGIPYMSTLNTQALLKLKEDATITELQEYPNKQMAKTIYESKNNNFNNNKSMLHG